MERLGLGGVAAQPVGSTYEATLPTGRLHGTVFFRTEHQFGLTVTEWGDGLLEVADAPPAPHRPDAGSAAILSFYGLPDDEVARVRAAWDRWWGEQFQPVELPGEGRPDPRERGGGARRTTRNGPATQVGDRRAVPNA